MAGPGFPSPDHLRRLVFRTFISFRPIKCSMKKGAFFALVSIGCLAWLTITYVLFKHRPSSTVFTAKTLNRGMDAFSMRLQRQIEQTGELLAKVDGLMRKTSSPRPNEPPSEDDDDVVIAVLVIACNRPTVDKAIEPLLRYRGTDPKRVKKFPIIVSQDCNHAKTAKVIEGYGQQVTFIRQPDQSVPVVTKAEKGLVGYFRISRHYGWAINETLLTRFRHDQVIIVEDDLEVAPDFFDYFEATLDVLRRDPSLWCVSAWNDNGKKDLIDETRPDLLYRSDFFGGLGWMMTRELWVDELMTKWPKSYWDDWMRLPAQRKGRACIRPETSRTRTFGKVGVSKGQFYEKHLKHVRLNRDPYPFAGRNLHHLLRSNYDAEMKSLLARLPAITVDELKTMDDGGGGGGGEAVKMFYKTKFDFKAAVKALGIMGDLKSGVPRTAYKGVVTCMHRGIRVYLTPGVNWKGYNPTW